jgi:hypothetical protein
MQMDYPNRKNILLVLAVIAGVFLLAALVINSGYLSGMVGLPIFLAFQTKGIFSLAAIVSGVIVFWVMLKVPFIKALWVSILVYLAWAVALFILMLGGTPLLIFLAGYFGIKRGMPGWVVAVIVSTMVVSLGINTTFQIVNYSYVNNNDNYLFYALYDVCALGLSILLQGITVSFLINDNRTWKSVVVISVLCFIFMVPASVYFFPSYGLYFHGMSSREAAWLSRAKGTLKSIGSAELAYREANSRHVYGSFDALQKSKDIAQGYTLGNMIENYPMTWRAVNTPGAVSNFTVIAWPRNSSPGYLDTFGITEDQIVRIFNPTNKKNQVEDVKTWDPIL